MAKNRDKKRQLNKKRQLLNVKRIEIKEKSFLKRMLAYDKTRAKDYAELWEGKELVRWLRYAGQGNARFADAGDAIQKYAAKFDIDLTKLENSV